MRSLKLLILLAFAVISSSSSFAQLKFEKSYKRTFKEAAVRQVPVFISVNYSTAPNLPALINRDIRDPAIAEYYRANFVNYQVAYDSPEGEMLTKKYGLKYFPCALFARPDGSLISKTHIPPIEKYAYLNLGAEAIKRFRDHKGLADYDLRYEQNADLDRHFFKDYINLRRNCGIFENAELIERYVDITTVPELNDYNEVLFILKAGPVVYSNPYRYALQNDKIADSIYKMEPLLERIWMHTHMINNTLSKAIRTKDHDLYRQMSFFAYAITPDHKKIEKQSALNYIIFYRGIKDTVNYYGKAPDYYDLLMSISPDSIKRLQSKVVESKDSPNAPAFLVKKDYMSVGTYHDENIGTTAFVLNNGAWDFYTYGTRDPIHLNKALTWSRRSIEIDPKATHYDTLAHLLYRMGRFDEALLNEKKAISIARKTKELTRKEIKGFKKEAKKMRESARQSSIS
jgi:tetratricopeptide (TPR) repeat protein